MEIAEGRTTPTCYMSTIARIYPYAGKTLANNTELLRKANLKEKISLIRNTVMKWLLDEGHKNQFFRIHYSGDFFDEEYARAWSVVIKEWPLVRFWVYTRSLFAVPILAECKNLALYISVDPVNREDALATYEPFKDYKNVALAFMGTPEGVDQKFIACPDISGKVKKDKEAGSCSKCRLCFTYNDKIKLRHIQFPIHR